METYKRRVDLAGRKVGKEISLHPRNRIRCPKCIMSFWSNCYNQHVIDCWQDLKLEHIEKIADFKNCYFINNVKKQQERLNKRKLVIDQELARYNTLFKILKENEVELSTDYLEQYAVTGINLGEEIQASSGDENEPKRKRNKCPTKYVHQEGQTLKDIWANANEANDVGTGVRAVTELFLKRRGVRVTMQEKCKQCKEKTKYRHFYYVLDDSCVCYNCYFQ